LVLGLSGLLIDRGKGSYSVSCPFFILLIIKYYNHG
jgi:hypothetical protein